MGSLDRIPEPWSASHRGFIIALLAGLLIYGSIQLLRNRAYVSNPQPITPVHASDLADKFDPNTADVPTLAVLPLIGDKRAADIIAYRERFVRDHPGEVAFKKIEDLQKIRGIGVATVEQIRPFLIFPDQNRPATEP